MTICHQCSAVPFQMDEMKLDCVVCGKECSTLQEFLWHTDYYKHTAGVEPWVTKGEYWAMKEAKTWDTDLEHLHSIINNKLLSRKNVYVSAPSWAHCTPRSKRKGSTSKNWILYGSFSWFLTNGALQRASFFVLYSVHQDASFELKNVTFYDCLVIQLPII